MNVFESLSHTRWVVERGSGGVELGIGRGMHDKNVLICPRCGHRMRSITTQTAGAVSRPNGTVHGTARWGWETLDARRRPGACSSGTRRSREPRDPA